jgi:hypothetical protein
VRAGMGEGPDTRSRGQAEELSSGNRMVSR